MKNRPQASTSSLFLMELICAIGFFCVCGAICVQLFVQAHLFNQDSLVLNQAVNFCSSAVESANVTHSSQEALELWTRLFPQGYADGGEFRVNFSESLSPCQEDGRYFLVASAVEDGTLLQIQCEFYDRQSETALYSLDLSHFTGGASHADET